MRKQPLHPRTASVNNKQKITSKHARHAALQWLAQQFPEAFDSKECIRPLKLGVMKDVLAYAEEAARAGISKSKLREAIVVFTRRIDYLACLKAQEMRIDLMGQPTTQVTAEEAEKAAAKIKKRIEKTIKNTHRPAASPAKAPAAAAAPRLTPHHYPEPAVFHHAVETPKRAMPSITVKPARSYDPQAVARLKAKLGLSLEKQGAPQES